MASAVRADAAQAASAFAHEHRVPRRESVEVQVKKELLDWDGRSVDEVNVRASCDRMRIRIEIGLENVDLARPVVSLCGTGEKMADGERETDHGQQ